MSQEVPVDNESSLQTAQRENLELKKSLSSLLERIDEDCNQYLSSSFAYRKPSGISRGREHMKKELECMNEKIGKLKSEIERSHQESSLRLVEDRMNATRKELSVVNEEIASLRLDAARQKKLLESNHSHQLLRSLEDEIAVEKALHVQLRKEAQSVGSYYNNKPRTV